MLFLRKLADRLISLSASAGGFCLLGLVGVILVDVVGRALSSPLFGSQDLINMGMAILVFGGMALCDRNGGHIAVDLLEPRYPPSVNRLIDIVAAFLGAIIFVMIAYTLHESAKLSQMLNMSTNLLRLPRAWFQWGVSVLSIITALGMALRGLELALCDKDVRKDIR